jgi:hypothetical protein
MACYACPMYGTREQTENIYTFIYVIAEAVYIFFTEEKL